MRILSPLALVALTTPALAHEYKIGQIVVDHPVAFETPKTARVGAGYMVIRNAGEADRLLEVRADFPKVQLHESVEDDKGVMSMEHLMSVEVPAGGELAFTPGGKHVMFVGLDGDPLEDGEKIPAVLVFEKAGELEVVFNVEKRAHGHNHSNH